MIKFPVTPTRASESSYWLAQALSREEGSVESLAGNLHADVCIVGGGYTGLWTAIELKQRDPGTEVVVLEAQLCGSGASGTNAGYLMNLWPKFPALEAQFGRAEATRLAQASASAVDDIVRFVKEHRIDAEVQCSGWLWASSAPYQDGAWSGTLESLAGVPGCPLRVVSPDEAMRMAGPAARGGVFDPTSCSLQPAALARGLRRVALQLGVKIFERSPMTALTREAGVVVSTPQGQVRAGSAVLAINAWATQLAPVAQRVLTTASDNYVTQPLSGEDLEASVGTGVGCSDSRRQLNYWRATTDNRVLFGKGGVAVGFGARGASSLFGPVPRRSPLNAHFDRIFPRLRTVATTSWRAPVEYSLSSLPFFTALKGYPRVFVGTGYSGDGVGPSRLGARILASLATGEVDEWSTSGLTRMPSTPALPPEPIRFLGGQVVRTALLRSDDARDRGRQPDAVSAGLARLDPTSWM